MVRGQCAVVSCLVGGHWTVVKCSMFSSQRSVHRMEGLVFSRPLLDIDINLSRFTLGSGHSLSLSQPYCNSADFGGYGIYLSVPTGFMHGKLPPVQFYMKPNYFIDQGVCV